MFLPGHIHRPRSLAEGSPWGSRESDMTEHTHHTHSQKPRFLLLMLHTPSGIPWKPPKQKWRAPLKSGWYTVLTIGPIIKNVLFFPSFLFPTVISGQVSTPEDPLISIISQHFPITWKYACIWMLLFIFFFFPILEFRENILRLSV